MAYWMDYVRMRHIWRDHSGTTLNRNRAKVRAGLIVDRKDDEASGKLTADAATEGAFYLKGGPDEKDPGHASPGGWFFLAIGDINEDADGLKLHRNFDLDDDDRYQETSIEGDPRWQLCKPVPSAPGTTTSPKPMKDPTADDIVAGMTGRELPGKSNVMLVPGSEEGRQELLAYGLWDGVLVAQHRGDEPGKFSTGVCEIDGAEIDEDRIAGLDTALRVAELGGDTPGCALALAWGQPPNGGGGGLFHEGGDRYGWACFSRGGPIGQGFGPADIHHIQDGPNGESYNIGHLMLRAPWALAINRDGPPDAEMQRKLPDGDAGVLMRTHLRFDEGALLWRWQTPVPVLIHDPADPPGGPDDVGDPTGAGDPPGGPGDPIPPPPPHPPPPPLPPFPPGENLRPHTGGLWLGPIGTEWLNPPGPGEPGGPPTDPDDVSVPFIPNPVREWPQLPGNSIESPAGELSADGLPKGSEPTPADKADASAATSPTPSAVLVDDETTEEEVLAFISATLANDSGPPGGDARFSPTAALWLSTSVPELVGKPTLVGSRGDDQLDNSSPSVEDAAAATVEAPACFVIGFLGAEDPSTESGFSYTQGPEDDGRHRYSPTVAGMAYITPPETDAQEAAQYATAADLAATKPNGEMSDVCLAMMPVYACLAFGMPNPETGGVRDGFSQSVEADGRFVIRPVDSDGNPQEFGKVSIDPVTGRFDCSLIDGGTFI